MPTQTRVLQTAAVAVALADELTGIMARVERFLKYNSNQAIDWAAAELPAYIPETGGVLTGMNVSRQQVANGIGTFDQLRKLLGNEAASQGDHLGNLNLLANPPNRIK